MSDAMQQAAEAVPAQDVVLDPMQEQSVARCVDVSRRCAATTGPAGSGKTTIIRTVYQRLRNAGYNVAIAAPTGKAAKRVSEATGVAAMTIHRLLEFSAPHEVDEKTGKPYGDTVPKRRNSNPLEHNAVIVDEYAMVHRELHRDIVNALPQGGRLLTFGDLEQLNPIEKHDKYKREMTAFNMLMHKFDGIRLTRVHRQTEGSGVLSNARRILDGKAPQNMPDFVMKVTDAPVDAVRALLPQCDYTSLHNQIISPMNTSWIGTYKLNALVQAEVMPRNTKYHALPRHKWDAKQPVRVAVGDKVVMNKNWYELQCSDNTLGVFNGEVGIVSMIGDNDTVTVDLDDRKVWIPATIEMQSKYSSKTMVGVPQCDLALAYVLTTHKCQGSEYRTVTYVMNKSTMMMLCRRNFYTAITRAREHVNLVTDMRALSLSLSRKEQPSW